MAVFLGGLMALSAGNLSKNPAHFVPGKIRILYCFEVDEQGGLFKIERSNTAADGIVIEVPVQALKRSVTVSVGLNDGKLYVPSGKTCGIVLVIDVSDEVKRFDRPLKITSKISAEKNMISVVGYTIDDEGRLHTLDTIFNNKSPDVVSFYTFRPVTLTWVQILNN